MVTYTLAGGCFWCLDAVFRQLKGVSGVASGYSGGAEQDANYYRVASATTGHAESVQITFDESIIPKDVILDLFFLIHNPTTKDRQGNDVGPQYRSAMFYESDEDKREFEEAVTRAQKNWDDPIVTLLEKFTGFYEAEPEHQDYYANNPANPYCSVVISPKVSKARKAYARYFTD